MYESKSDLPETLQKFLPENLQEIYLDAYQKSWEAYDESEGGDMGREGVAHRDAMTAIEQDYVHDQESGKWYPRDQQPKGDSEDEDEVNPFKNIKEETGEKNE